MSFPVAFNHINEQSGIVTEYEYDTKPENMHVLYYIARNQLYSDEPMAVLREYGINAMDIHIQVGKPELPIQITLPTQLDSQLKIRDFGPGLDEKGMQEYVSFGESSKRGDPLQTGQLGIGCKSGFTYGDSFLVNSYMGGKLTAWNAYIDPSNKGKLAKLVECDTTEPDGLEVIIPVKANDVNKFHEKAMFFFSFAKVTPVFINDTDDDREQMKALKETAPVFSGEGWKYMGKGTSYAIMGNIPYPIRADVFTDDEIRSETKELLEGGIVINFKMDELDFAASREQLKYTPKTKKNVSAKLTDITTDLMKQCSISFDGCKTLWDAKILYKTVFDFYGKLYRLRNLFKSSLTFKGFKINTETFDTRLSNGSDTDVICWQYSSSGTSKLRRQQVFNLHADNSNLVVVNDTGIVNGIMNRVVGQLCHEPNIVATTTKNVYKNVYILSFVTDTARDLWIAETGFDATTVSLASLPKEAISKYFPSAPGGNGSYRNSKHMSREFTYNGDNKSRYRDNRSSFWDVAEVDLDNDEGIYVVIERFHYAFDGRDNHPVELLRFLNKLKAAGIETPDTIYGFKKASVAQAQNNPKMVPLKMWFQNAMDEYILTHPELEQEYANREYLDNAVESMYTDLPGMLKTICKWNGIPNTHSFHTLSGKLRDLSNFKSDKLEAFKELAKMIGYACKVTPIHDVKAELDTLMAKYPLLFKMSVRMGYYRLSDQEWSTPFEQYISLIDALP